MIAEIPLQEVGRVSNIRAANSLALALKGVNSHEDNLTEIKHFTSTLKRTSLSPLSGRFGVQRQRKL
jgi:hypothetical protein